MSRRNHHIRISCSGKIRCRWKRDAVPELSSRWSVSVCQDVMGRAVRRILILDDYSIFREGLSICLQNRGFSVCSMPFSAMSEVAVEEPQVLLVAISRIEQLESIAFQDTRRKYPNSKILAIIDDVHVSLAKNLLRHGILGCISRRKGVEDFVKAIDTAGHEAVYFERALATQLLTEYLFASPVDHAADRVA
jgi:DNA-binding NarL/FixJ family response regulator